MEKTFCVYLITCTASGKRYVGLTSRTAPKRFKTHVYNGLNGREGALYAAIRKYGPEAFVVKTVAEGLLRRDACEQEILHIRRFNTKSPNGYNLTDGGDGATGQAMSAETRARMSATHKARQADPELRRRTSEALKGVPKTPEHNAKVAAANTGKTHSEETRAKLAAAATGVKQSAETIAKRAEKLRGKIKPEHCRNRLGDWSRGRPKTDEQKRKISEALKGRKLSPEHIEAAAAGRRGKPKSDEWKAKIRVTNELKRLDKALALLGHS